jgi:hypothetical protein
MRRALLLIAVVLAVAVACAPTDALAGTTLEPSVVVLQDSVTDPSAVANELAGPPTSPRAVPSGAG